MTSPVHRALADMWTAQLRAAREFRRLSQGAVGARMGVSGQRIWKWESLIHRPSTDLFGAWAETVGWELLMVPAGSARLDAAWSWRVAAVLARAEEQGSAVVSIAAVRKAMDQLDKETS